MFSYALSRSNDSFSSSWLPYSSTCSYLLLYTFSFSVPFYFKMKRQFLAFFLPSSLQQHMDSPFLLSDTDFRFPTNQLEGGGVVLHYHTPCKASYFHKKCSERTNERTNFSSLTKYLLDLGYVFFVTYCSPLHLRSRPFRCIYLG